MGMFGHAIWLDRMDLTVFWWGGGSKLTKSPSTPFDEVQNACEICMLWVDSSVDHLELYSRRMTEWHRRNRDRKAAKQTRQKSLKASNPRYESFWAALSSNPKQNSDQKRNETSLIHFVSIHCCVLSQQRAMSIAYESIKFIFLYTGQLIR